jgi:hypothetical protein
MIMILMYFFGQRMKMPHYKAPANVKVLPVGSQGNPILTVVDLFSQKPQSVIIQWSLSGRQVSGDAGQQPVFQDFAAELVPPFFVIEKSTVNPNQTIDASQLSNPTATGLVTMSVQTNFESSIGSPTTTTINVPDHWNDPFIKFQKYIPLNPLLNFGQFFAGTMGSYSYIDNDVTPGQTYWYRVRAAAGVLSIDLSIKSDGSVTFDQPMQDAMDGQYRIVYPGANPTAVVGKPSPIHSITVPVFSADTFDVMGNLVALFEAAFSLNFHLPYPTGATFDSSGMPTGTTSVTQIGLGTLSQLAGSLVSFTAVPILGKAAASVGSVSNAFTMNPATGEYPQPPWATFGVSFNAHRLAITVAGALANTNNIKAFEKYMLGPYPKVPGPNVLGLFGATNPSELVLGLTPTITSTTDPDTLRTAWTTYGNAFVDAGTRLNIQAAVQYVKTFLLAGVPPDWKSIQLLRDIIPWAGQLLNELVAKIQALLEAFKGLMKEIIDFITLIERKITVLEQFIEWLISLLNFLISLELGLFVLLVPELSGDISSWFAAIDGAGGEFPTSGPNGYTGGIALAYIAPNVAAFASALELIF